MLNTSDRGDFPDEAAAVIGGRDHVRIDNTHLSPAEVARQVADRFGLPTPEGAGVG
jgi:hypothetical protein